VKITLNQIKDEHPCEDSWEKLLKALGKTKSDDEVFDARIILKTNDLSYFCWVLDRVLGKEKELRFFAYWNAKQSLNYIPDKEKQQYKKVINTINLYAHGLVGDSARNSAKAAAWYSAWDSAAATASASAAWDSAWCSARDPAWYSAWDSAWCSARDPVEDSAWYSAWAAGAAAWDSYIKKAEKKLLKILAGELPAVYKGSNHFGEREGAEK
jgi:hypothetical protein